MKELLCEIDCECIRRNIREVGKPVILMVKADCYGLGLTIIKEVESSVTAYGVAFGQEGRAVRTLTDKPILVTTPLWTMEDVVRYDLTPCVQSVREIDKLREMDRPCAVHIKLNTGMNRFGISDAGVLREVVRAIDAHPYLYIAGAYTHYASATEYIAQNKRLLPLLRLLPKDICVHTQASSTVARKGYDMVRLGLQAYAHSVRLISRVIALRYVKPNQKVGYDGIYTPDGAQWIAIVAGGYADGIAKSLKGHLVAVNGHMRRVVAVCMDVCMIALDAPIPVGSQVTILGDSPEPYGRTLYEMYTGIGVRFNRDYKGIVYENNSRQT
jgi:alanine racemase